MRFSAVLTGPVVAGLVLAAGLASPGLLSSGLALAQSAAPPAAGTPATPTDVKPIGDWTVRCFPVTSTSPCDMYEELDDKNSHQRVLSVSIAFVPSADKYAVQIAVPLGIAIANGAIIQTDNYTSPKLPYRRCDRGGCYVEMILPNDMVAALGRSGPNASVKILADNGKPFALRFSLNGFAAANDAMMTLAKQKAKGTAPTPPAAPPKK